MGRNAAVLKNMVWEIGYYAIVLMLGFLAPRYIISIYGSDVNGLTASINQILNVMLLIQAGATTAAIYELFSPISRGDYIGVSKLIAQDTKFFRRISSAFAFLILPAAILSSILIRSELDEAYVFFAFLLMGLKSYLDIRFTSKYRIVFTAFQEKYLLSIATLIEQVLYYLLVFASLYFSWPFMTMYAWFFAGCIAKIVYLKRKYDNKYRELIPPATCDVSAGIPERRYSLANEVSHSVISAFPAIAISIVCGLQETSVYSIYAMVASALSLFSTAVYSAFGPSFGNYVASNDLERAGEVFGIFQYIYIAINSILVLSMLYLLIPFVALYIENAESQGYINHLLAALISVNGLVSAFRVPYNVVVSSCGYFRETWLQPVVAAAIALFGAYFLVRCSYPLVLLGPIFFYVANFVYQHYRLRQLAPALINDKTPLLFLASLGGAGITCWLSSFGTPVAGVSGFVMAIPATLLITALFVLITFGLIDGRRLILAVRYLKGLGSKAKRI